MITKNTMLNPKIHSKSIIQHNYSSTNYIPELLMANSVVVNSWNGVDILANHKCGAYISYVTQFERLI